MTKSAVLESNGAKVLHTVKKATVELNGEEINGYHHIFEYQNNGKHFLQISFYEKTAVPSEELKNQHIKVLLRAVYEPALQMDKMILA